MDLESPSKKLYERSRPPAALSSKDEEEEEEEEDSTEEEEEDDGKESQARGKREACVREVRRGEGGGGEEARWSELGKVRAPTAAADFREVPRSQAAARCNQHVTSWIWKVITRLSHGPVSGSDLSIVSIPLRHRRALPRRRSVPGVPLSTGEQSSVGARTKRMTLVRIARISVVLVVSLLLLLLLLIVDGSWAQAYPREIKPGCRYEGRRYQEGTAVSTSEPCLQCWCTEGALRCRLRVCPRLPNPPPSGCHVRSPAENVCCAEMVCGESRDVENMLRRASVQTNIEAEDEEKHAQNSRTEGCLHDGIQYGSGSAMMGSRRCEYCYCISGTRRCLRPKCLLPLPGCTPLALPIALLISFQDHHPSTMAPVSGNGCRVGERTYVEGEMVRDIEWKAACDNCFCAMGAIRCVPLACAPPLQGCSPIVREGQCCPSTYNCSGSIEVKATQNYASYAFVSKDYAKFRKETNFFLGLPYPNHKKRSLSLIVQPAIDQSTNPSVEGRGHRVVEERISTSTIDLEEDSSVATYSTAWPSTMETDIMDNEILIGTVDYKSTLEVTTTATLTNELSSNTESTASFESTPASKDADSVTRDSCTTCSTNTFTDSTTEDASSTDSSTISLSEWTTMLPELTLNNGNDENEDTGGDENKNTSENEERNEDEATERETMMGEKTDIIEKNKTTVHPFVVSTDAGKTLIPEKLSSENSTLIKRTKTGGKRPVTSPSSTILMPDDILVMNVTVKTNVSVGHIQGVTINPIRSIPPDIETILNITHREKSEDYDYDYSERLLPPSLPNVRIIPFVAADALVKGKDVPSSKTGYSLGSVVVPPKLRPTDASGFYDIATQENRFSPPVETEGGFIPREPSYFDVPYRSTDLNLEIGTGVTVVPQITNPHKKNNDLSNKCHFEDMEYRHGEILPRAAFCIICMCYYGEIVCSSQKCPPLKIGCRRINSEEKCCGKIVCVEADESPTVVLDRADATAPSQRQPTVSPDPFRDVIKTEPAPDLPSLIEDMIPYLVERGITTPKPTTTMTASKTSAQDLVGNQLQHPPNFDFMEVPLIQPPFDYGEETVDSSFLAKMKYGANRETFPTDTVSLTYDFKNQVLDHKPFENPEADIFDYDRTMLTKLNSTTDGSKYDFHRSNSMEQKFAMGNVSETKNLDRNFTSEEDNRTTRYDNRTESDNFPSEDGKTTENVEDVTIFSLDNVLKLLFSSNTSSSNKLTETTKTLNVSSVSGVQEDQETLVVSSTSAEGLTEETETVETSSKVLDNEIPMSVGSLLKLAGCNIYGRMYRVGRIITELSSPCEECKCTEIGVRCEQLEC
ncbi:KCP protein, partial [Acromyrmex insinuator]